MASPTRLPPPVGVVRPRCRRRLLRMISATTVTVASSAVTTVPSMPLQSIPNRCGCASLAVVTRGASDMLTAVDVDLGAVDVGRRLRAQRVDHARNFVGRAKPAERNLRNDLFRGAGRENRGVDLAR